MKTNTEENYTEADLSLLHLSKKRLLAAALKANEWLAALSRTGIKNLKSMKKKKNLFTSIFQTYNSIKAISSINNAFLQLVPTEQLTGNIVS